MNPTAEPFPMSDPPAAPDGRMVRPPDMGIHPLRDNFAEGCTLKAPWLADYLWQRRSWPSVHACHEWLRINGADATPLHDRVRGSLLGLAVGNALGVPLQFAARDAATVSDMTGGGPYALAKGSWTAATSMACCLAYSLIRCGGSDPRHQLQCYAYWYRTGVYGPGGRCVGIGGTTRRAIEAFLRGETAAGHPEAAGNGALARLAPVAVFCHDDLRRAMDSAAESCRTTHPAREAVDACRYLAAILVGLLNGADKETVLAPRYSPVAGLWDECPLAPAVDAIARGSFKDKPRERIVSGGYAVETLEAALWAFHHHDSFRDGALAAVNLAGDADAAGAVYGQIAGACYGETGIPIDWIMALRAPQAFYHFADDLLAARPAPAGG